MRKGEEITVVSHRERVAKIVPIKDTLKFIPAIRPVSDLKKIKGVKLSKPFDPLADLLADRRKRGRSVYLDTSMVLRHLTREPDAIRSWSDWTGAYSSILMRIEALRAFDRWRLAASLTDRELEKLTGAFRQFCDSITFAPLTDEILERTAGSFPSVIGTLDAIHVATALAVAEADRELLFLTHDPQLARAARILGFPVQGC